jgi:hypothetical protein
MMRSMSAVLLAGAALAVAGLMACSNDDNSQSPTTVTTLPRVTTPIVTLPDLPGACSPAPPPLYDILVEIKSSDGYTRTLKATPRVPNTNGYCDKVGFGAYKFCNVRRDGDPQKEACEGMVLGRATDTNRWGPTWKYSLNYEQEHLCTGSDPGCTNHGSNQYLVTTKGSGVFFACANPTVPLSTDPNYPGSRCTRCNLKNDGKDDCK